MKLSERAPDVPPTATSVLVLQSSEPSSSNRAAKRLLVPREGGVRVAGVSFARSPDDWGADWRDALGRSPEAAAVVTDAESDRRDAGPSVYTVSSPGDLTGIGMKLSACLSEWEGTDADVVVVVESLTHLLQYAQLETLYRFLHVLVGRIDAVGARGLFFFDPTTRDEMTVNTLKTLFDAVVERRGDDGWAVASR
ncbi:hypothetical protein SAMN04488063_0331 [Halopelagius inordinatus]|uniref:DUF835 domain-containing protein n=1 Tax=Halopelagius inordinatus TaxID=553467 RepID=A0A1I2LLE7_9EURY|nr:hypothetical protein [Halopelagius inordinatus]SFF79943.1 hypothetical protein SAMN04488063_0331 [Halopelagius inordinatus]